jgi:hypothetical protein
MPLHVLLYRGSREEKAFVISDCLSIRRIRPGEHCSCRLRIAGKGYRGFGFCEQAARLPIAVGGGELAYECIVIVPFYQDGRECTREFENHDRF